MIGANILLCKNRQEGDKYTIKVKTRIIEYSYIYKMMPVTIDSSS